nr:hypothetical protein [Ruegeria sediminis]
MAGFAQSICHCDEFSGNGGDNGFVRFSSRAEAISEDFQSRVVMSRNQRGLEHHMTQQASSTANGSFPAQGPTVMGDWREPGQGGLLFARDLAEFGHLGDQHRTGYRADPRNGAQDFRGLSQLNIGRDNPVHSHFQFGNLAIEERFEGIVHVIKEVGCSELSMCFDLRKEPFACFDKLSTL